ncbi:MAG: hypothetical protein Q9163_003981 [Psora crenata]
MTFEDIANKLGRNEVAVAAIFYGQAQTTPEDLVALSEILAINHSWLKTQLAGYPFRGQAMEMPPKEPLIYRLYEIVQNYGSAYKAILNEKFGDGIMSAISFSTKVEKETDKDGNDWARQSKRASKSSANALLSPITPGNSNAVANPAWPDSPYSLRSLRENDITPPAPRRHLHRLSDIIDPRTILEDAYSPLNTPTRPSTSGLSTNTMSKSSPLSGRGIVQSPSGNTLGALEFIAHPNRPLAIWERQERVLQATREGMERLEAASKTSTRNGWRATLGKSGGGTEKGKGGRRKSRCCGLY